jgi:hypothetical protein
VQSQSHLQAEDGIRQHTLDRRTGELVTLMFKNSKWNVIGGNSYTLSIILIGVKLWQLNWKL